MATQRTARTIGVGTLAKAMSGDCPCLYQAWFPTHYECKRSGESPELIAWKAAHTRMLIELDRELQEQGAAAIYRERWIDGYARAGGVRICGKVDRIVVQPPWVIVYECKSGKVQGFHTTQTLIYLHLLTQRPEFRQLQPYGVVRYHDQVTEIDTIPDGFAEQFDYFVQILADSTAPSKAPGAACRFCPVQAVDCPERIEFVSPAAPKERPVIARISA